MTDTVIVIAEVVRSRRADVYTRVGARDMVSKYYATVGEDPAAEA